MSRKPRILLDCDGVLANFTDHLIEKISESCVRPDKNTFTEWDFIKGHLTPDQLEVAEHILAGQQFWETQPIMPGAQEAVSSFQKCGFSIHIVTSAWGSCEGWADVRTRWIRRHFGIEHKFVHVAGTKYLYGGLVFVDDKFEHIVEWQDDQDYHGHSERSSFFFEANTPYAKNVEWKNKISGWDKNSISNILEAADHAESVRNAAVAKRNRK